MTENKVVLGLSGGVDSAVAALLLQKAGYAVFGLFLDIGRESEKAAAMEAAAALGIPLECRKIEQELEAFVCRPFAEAYLRGETPNPCIFCNPTVKFPALLRYADEIGAEKIATGHYARVQHGILFKGKSANDQSYMLSRLSAEQRSRLLLPLGELEKAEVRRIAAENGLCVAAKPDSMEICFIPDGDFGSFIERRSGCPGDGDIVDENGARLGRHHGFYRYTLGQRRGLGVATGKRVFVSEIRPERNEVVLSEGDGLWCSEIRVRDICWMLPPAPCEEFRASVKIRHSKTDAEALVIPDGDNAVLLFDEAVRAPTAGQQAVAYDGDRVLFGGYITD